MQQIFSSLPNNPLFIFAVCLLVILTLPPVFEKLRLPGLVGLLAAGVILGKDGLHLIDSDSSSIKLFSDIGKIYLMFVAGLEIDLAEFRKTKYRSLGFGIATFTLPLFIGATVSRTFGFGWTSSILIGSLLASHTLLSYPIVQRLGVVKNEAVTVTIGATIFTDIAALLLLGICVSIHNGGFSWVNLSLQLLALALYTTLVLIVLDRVGREYFHRTGNDESNQFLFVLLALFVASVGAQLINIDKIVGAFLAGLAVNDVLGEGPVKEKVEFVGGTLFIPFFFVGMGVLLDIPAFAKTVQTQLPLVVGIVGGLMVAKLMAATLATLLYRYSWQEGLTMWSLSLPQVAATLAAALAAYQTYNAVGEPLIDETVFNSIIVLMLVTAILGPLLTAKFARKLKVRKKDIAAESSLKTLEDSPLKLERSSNKAPFTVIVPIYNPYTQRYLIEMAALLARHKLGRIVPLSIAIAKVNMDDPQLNDRIRQSQGLLYQSEEIARHFDVVVEPAMRIDDDVALAINRTAREKEANLVVMGWSRMTGLRVMLLGNVINSVFSASHCPIAVMRLLEEPSNLRRVLVPLKNISSKAIQTIRFAQLFAKANKASITLLHVCSPDRPSEKIASFKQELTQVMLQSQFDIKWKIKIIAHEDVAKVIVRVSQIFDLVILRSVRRRTAGGLAVSDVTTKALEKLTCSLVLFGEPHS